MTSNVTCLGPAAHEAWQDFLIDRPAALVFHHPAWLRALCSAQGYEALVLGHYDAAGALDGVLPLVNRSGWITGRRLISLPHTPVAGPVAANREAATALCSAALERAREIGARLELKTANGVLDETCAGIRRTPWSITFVLELPDDQDIRFGTGDNHRAIAWAVRKAGREGVTVRDARCDADLLRWHELYLATMRTHAVPPRPLGFFLALWAGLRPEGLLRLVLAERNGRLVAGSIFLLFGSTVFYAFNGSCADAGRLHPNDLIQWHMIHEAVRAGFRRYDLGEVESDNPGLARFKAKWGATPQPLFRYVDPPLNARNDTRNLERARHWGDGIWRRLPLAATARVGDVVYRRL